MKEKSVKIGREFKIGDKVTYGGYNNRVERVLNTSLIVGWKEEREAVVEKGIFKVKKGFCYLVSTPEQILPNPVSNWELCKTEEQYSIEELLTSESEIYRNVGRMLQKKEKAEEKRKKKLIYPYR
jgi:hypothetical protein